MIIVGTMTTIGLWLLGIPLALALGIIAFFLEFVPYIGPILAAIPAVLIASTIGSRRGALRRAALLGRSSRSKATCSRRSSFSAASTFRRC